MDPALGCTPFMAPDLANNDRRPPRRRLTSCWPPRTSRGSAALVPENDEMVLDATANLDPAKTNLYRAEVGQAPINAAERQVRQPGELLPEHDQHPEPVPGGQPGRCRQAARRRCRPWARNLFTFLANRLLMSFDNLGCQNFGLTNPVTVALDGAGAAMSATINTTPQQASIVGGQGATAGGGGGWRWWRRLGHAAVLAADLAAVAGPGRPAQGP